MLDRLTDSYLILLLTVVSIIIAIVGENTVQLLCVNILFLLTMSLISLRGVYKHNHIYSHRSLKIIFFLISTAFISDVFLYFNWVPNLKTFFLVYTGLIKIGVFGYGWLTTVKLLSHRSKVTNQTIILAITAYLFIGIICSFIYFTIWQIDPQAFHINVPREYELKPWNLAMYFSLITLTTVGYGDIFPIGKWVMVLANFEAMAGAIYLTVIVARLVSLYSTPE
ncbi:potassium channel family protein [Crocosphaera sp. XPORK-15E]|uniref:potassium channel family protein n=1 Tax=Crocosphaera sp. XPORK-15E TaxID=3110247 RepID=UPI002B21FC92|nr:potassium channel family protein [Crocosphaera sp. XPORK-15E]MEA5532559.1 potassium channel family protein [Crocosphaera sp. XPORK-15E]